MHKELLLFMILDKIDIGDIKEYMELRKKQKDVLDKFKHLEKLNDQQINDLKDYVKKNAAIISTTPPMGRWNAAQEAAFMYNTDMLDFVL